MNDLLVQSLAGIIQYLGATPLLLFFAAMGLGPWIATIWIARSQDKRMVKVFERQDKRFEEVVNMYERNVDLVKSHEKINENLQDLIILTTQTLQTLVEYIKNNLFCPIVKQRTQPDKIQGDDDE